MTAVTAPEAPRQYAGPPVRAAHIQKATPPVPEQAIEEAKRTSEALKSDGN